MRLRLLNLVLAALLALAAARLWTAQRAPLQGPPPSPEAGGEAAPPSAPPPVAAAAAAATAGAGGEGYDAIVARDLFSAARGVVPPAPPAAAKPAPKPAPAPKLTLTGVVVVDGEKSAYLHEGTAEAKPRRVREGESFAGGTVKSIRPDGVTFLFAGSETAIPLRTPKDAGPAPRPGDLASIPVPPEAVPRRITPPETGAGMEQPRRPQTVVPGAPQLMTPPEEGFPAEEEIFPEDEEGMDVIDEGEVFDEEEIPPEEFEEQPE